MGLSAHISCQMSHLLRLGQIIPLHFLASCIWAIFRVLTNMSKDGRAIAGGAVASSLSLLAVACSCTSHGWVAAQLSPHRLQSHPLSSSGFLWHQNFSTRVFLRGALIFGQLFGGFFLPLPRLDYPSLPERCPWVLVLYLCMQFSFLLLSHLLPGRHSAILGFWLPFLNWIVHVHCVSTCGSAEETGVGRDASGSLERLL